MHYDIRYQPTFSTLFLTLAPGDGIVTEAGAMASMSSQLTMKTAFSGGFLPALLKRLFGGESLFVNTFTNQTQQPHDLVITQSVIGDMVALELNGEAICLQSGAYIASTRNIHMGLEWAGFSSFFAGEGLFRLKLSGKGLVFFGAYGGITKKRLDGEFIVDSGHLVAYSPGIKMHIQLAGGLVGSVTSGEGLVNRLSGEGEIYLQSRSIEGLVRFLRTKF